MKYFCMNCVSVWSGKDYSDPKGRIRKHVDSEGHHCPHCGSVNIIKGKERINAALSMDNLSLKDFEYGKGV
jgi:DNA-directed RNA polymerase subunit RPC12/RpoP